MSFAFIILFITLPSVIILITLSRYT